MVIAAEEWLRRASWGEGREEAEGGSERRERKGKRAEAAKAPQWGEEGSWYSPKFWMEICLAGVKDEKTRERVSRILWEGRGTGEREVGGKEPMR